ncbi:MAG: class I SAM-dependent methyltransferase [Salibacter sp.]|uniref:O-methyltransferase n=1 Tax=Salibacter sp. TaxID=2010995 RepID=UPI00287094F2|nr:class I SAM-dependent methyltransferase [Salibacter sp.]MDR9398512.1 class I SAM-dependent methyltransferase [Salibacter sp.]
MDFIEHDILDYAINHSDSEPEILQQLNRETHIKVLNPRMLAGDYQGRLLSMISFMIRPKNILEIGTYTGYSALCWLEGLKDDGEIHTIDKNEELQPILKKYLKLDEPNNPIHFHLGEALEIIDQLDKDWDLVFLDADKSNYLNYYEKVIPKMKPGSFIVADNVLWSGKVLDEKANDEDTIALKKFNQHIKEDDRVSEIMLPIRDGITIIRKL